MSISGLPTISIVIPTYNSQHTLSRCLDSVVEQTYPNVEIIIIDGRSTDHTVDIIKRYASRITYWVSEPDEGIYDAMNKGIRVATGRWVYFLGSDDVLYDNQVLEKVFNRDIPDNYQVVYGNVVSSKFKGLYDGEFTIEKILEKNICHQSLFTRRSLFNKIGNFDSRFRSHADWDFNLRWFLNGSLPGMYIDMIVANYADGGFSSTTKDEQYTKERLEKIFAYGQNTLPKPFIERTYVLLLVRYLRNKQYKKCMKHTFFYGILSKNRLVYLRALIAKIAQKFT